MIDNSAFTILALALLATPVLMSVWAHRRTRMRLLRVKAAHRTGATHHSS